MKTLRMAVLALAALVSMAAAANDPRERLANPQEEARARALFQQIRCLVCQNETIDDSEADLAGDLRRIVRAQVHAGATDEQVRAFLVARYGEFVLYRPRFGGHTWLLWLAPALLVLAGGLVIARILRVRSRQPMAADEDQEW